MRQQLELNGVKITIEATAQSQASPDPCKIEDFFNRHVVVESSCISWFYYDVKKVVMSVGFKSGKIYNYEGVPAKLYFEWICDLLAFGSAGKFFNANIRDQFQFEQTA